MSAFPTVVIFPWLFVSGDCTVILCQLFPIHPEKTCLCVSISNMQSMMCANDWIHYVVFVSLHTTLTIISRGGGRPHPCVVARATTAPDAKTWSIPTVQYQLLIQESLMRSLYWFVKTVHHCAYIKICCRIQLEYTELNKIMVVWIFI